MIINENEETFIGSHWSYKGNEYRVIRKVALKHPETREWVPAVVYLGVNDPVGVEFCREDSEFKKRFKCEPIPE